MALAVHFFSTHFEQRSRHTTSERFASHPAIAARVFR
jgi:hypothetical protein